MTSKPSSYGPTHAVAEALEESSIDGDPIISREIVADDVLIDFFDTEISVNGFLTALRERGYIVTREYQE